jgi:hypothetical protein
MRSRKPASGPHTNSRMVRLFWPSRSREAGITAISGALRSRPVSGRIAPAVQDHDAVDGNLDAIAEARQEHRPRALRLEKEPV